MGGTGVIDRFLEVFTSYIDSGFGLPLACSAAKLASWRPRLQQSILSWPACSGHGGPMRM
jgi:hypothetical protein